jgi:hypothetical protein
LRRAGLPIVALLLALGAAGLARAETVGEGNLLVGFDGGISPHALPRTGVAPVSVDIDTSFRTADGSDPPPQLSEVEIAINRHGKIEDRGLPVCHVGEIQPSTIAAARRICGGAIVGSGHVVVRVVLPNQPVFTFEGPMLVFNGERAAGHRRAIAQVYGTKPPSAFVLNFSIVKGKGEFGTVIRTALPEETRKWAYVTDFRMHLRRIYTYRGQQHSYISAGCPAPPGFPGAIYKFSSAQFRFANGQAIGSTLVRDCNVRG